MRHQVTQLRRSILAVGKETSLLFLALSLVNASNYVFHVVISQHLGPADYGALGSVLAILTVLSVPLAAIQAGVARRTAAERETGRSVDSWVEIARSLLAPSLVLTGFLLLLSPLLVGLLQLESLSTAMLVSAYVVPAVLVSVLRGALQGRMMFGRLALVSLIPVAVRLVVGIGGVRAGLGVPAAVGASVLGDAVGVLLAVAILRPSTIRVSRNARSSRFLREVGPILLGLAAAWALIELDLVLARHFLPAEEAGEYAAAGLLARAVLFVPGAISLIALPHFSQHEGRGRKAYEWLLASCIITVGLGVITAGVLSIAGQPIVELTFGRNFEGAADLLPMLSMAMLGFGLVNLLVYFHIAARSSASAILLLVAAAELVAVSFWHDSGAALGSVVMVLSWMVAIGGFALTRALALGEEGIRSLPTDVRVKSPKPPADSGAAPELSLVVPCHAGGTKLSSALTAIDEGLDRLGKSHELVIVSDGSVDVWDAVLEAGLNSATVVHYERRHGKGVALRLGMTQATGRYVAFIDGDGELDSAEFKNFLALMDLYNPDFIIGSKRHPLSVVDYPATRRLMSWAYHRVVRILFGVNVRDTQTGMKLIRREVLDAVLPRMLEKRFAFDLEFMVVARRLGYKRVLEAPVRLTYRFDSTVSFGEACRILLDTAAIFYRRYLLHYYDRPVGAASSLPRVETSPARR
jgi:O-antigen/teichoic acid export membrane protein